MPLDATVFQIEHRSSRRATGSRCSTTTTRRSATAASANRDLTLTPGTDLATVFPDNAVHTTGADLDLHFVDSFDVVDGPRQAAQRPGAGFAASLPRAHDRLRRPAEPRTGARPHRCGWRSTSRHRCRCRVTATRVLVPDAPDLTADERALLGTSDNAVVLRWGWGQDQRRPGPVRRRVPRLRRTADGLRRRHRHGRDAAVERTGHLVPRRRATRRCHRRRPRRRAATRRWASVLHPLPRRRQTRSRWSSRRGCDPAVWHRFRCPDRCRWRCRSPPTARGRRRGGRAGRSCRSTPTRRSRRTRSCCAT